MHKSTAVLPLAHANLSGKFVCLKDQDQSLRDRLAPLYCSFLKPMNVRAEFEQEKGGRWIATIPAGQDPKTF